MSDPGQLSYDELFALAVEEARRKGVPIADPTPPIRQTCVVNGRRLHFLDWQGGARTPMLLLHGALLNAHVWDFFSLDMRGDYRIRALDLPGHGDSEWAADGDYSRAAAADAVVTLIEQLDLTSLVLVGHSFGGSLGALVAARRTPRVRALVMVDSTLLPTGQPSVRSLAAAGPDSFESLDKFAEYAAGLARHRDPARLAVRLRWNARQLPDGRWTWKYDPALRQRPLGPRTLDDVWAALDAFPGPVLFVRASERSHVSDEAAQRLRALPNVRLVVVPDAMHNVMGDNPLGFRHEVNEFLSGL
jgi:pimeloyl-ACP methyl ester carboxylesterase